MAEGKYNSAETWKSYKYVPDQKPQTFSERMMAKMGYKAGEGLGKSGEGIKEPVSVELGTTRRGLGAETPRKKGNKQKKAEKAEKEKAEKEKAEKAERAAGNEGKDDDGWQHIWHETSQVWLFYNRLTQTSTPHNPRDPSSYYDGWRADGMLNSRSTISTIARPTSGRG